MHYIINIIHYEYNHIHNYYLHKNNFYVSFLILSNNFDRPYNEKNINIYLNFNLIHKYIELSLRNICCEYLSRRIEIYEARRSGLSVN